MAVEAVGGMPFRMYAERPRHAIAAKVRELVALGVVRGARVFLLGWNSPEWIVNFWACLLIGATPVLANGWWSQGELAKDLAALQPALTLADAHGTTKMPPAWRCGPWEVDTTHALLAGLQMLLHVTRRLPHQLDETAAGIGLHTGPLFHVGGVQTLLRAITVGSTLVMPRGIRGQDNGLRDLRRQVPNRDVFSVTLRKARR